MDIKISICIALALAGTIHVSANVVDMRCGYRVDPIGIDVSAPRLTWTYDSADIPARYSIELSETSRFKGFRSFETRTYGHKFRI